MTALPDRLEKMKALRASGANCSQCVLGSFADITGLPEAASMRLAQGLGGGVGGTGEVCGVLSAMALLQGFVTEKKPETYARVRRLKEEFQARCGSCLCRELKAPGARIPCHALIETGVRLFHSQLPPE